MGTVPGAGASPWLEPDSASASALGPVPIPCHKRQHHKSKESLELNPFKHTHRQAVPPQALLLPNTLIEPCLLSWKLQEVTGAPGTLTSAYSSLKLPECRSSSSAGAPASPARAFTLPWLLNRAPKCQMLGIFLPHPLLSLSVSPTTSSILCFPTTSVYQRGVLYLSGLLSWCHPQAPQSLQPGYVLAQCRCPSFSILFLVWPCYEKLTSDFYEFCGQRIPFLAFSQGAPGVALWPRVSVVNPLQEQFGQGAHSGPGV